MTHTNGQKWVWFQCAFICKFKSKTVSIWSFIDYSSDNLTKYFFQNGFEEEKHNICIVFYGTQDPTFLTEKSETSCVI